MTPGCQIRIPLHQRPTIGYWYSASNSAVQQKDNTPCFLFLGSECIPCLMEDAL